MFFLNQLPKTVFLIFILLSAHCEAVHAQTSGKFILFDGTQKFSAGDNPTWASPEYDDSKWQQIKIPGSWQSQGTKSAKGMGWYRIRFNIPNGFNVYLPAVLIGRIGDVDEVFFNGVKIGGEGIIGDRFIEATKVERLYSVQPNLINYNKDNILAVRVMNTYLNGGIFDKGAAFGDYNLLKLEKVNRENVIIVIEFCLFTFFAMFFVACFFLYIKGLRDKEYIFFWLFISLYGLLVFLGSITFYKTGLKTLYVQQTISSLSAILPFFLVLLLVHMCQIKYYLHIKFFLAIYFFIAVALPFTHGYTARAALLTFWKITFILTAIYIAYLSVRVYVRKFNESGPLLLGVTGLVFGLILESIAGLDLVQITGFFLWDYSAIFFMICVMYALTSRYTRIQKELRSASVKIFDAHEEERKRLSRELHDGVGQSLLSFKLKMKMIDKEKQENFSIDRKEFRELLSDISGIISELKDVSMDLRPAFLEDAELVEAITWHAERMQEKSGVAINIHQQDSVKINPRLKDNIYRIFQEALSNAIQHSEADTVNVILDRKEKNFYLEIRDNGKGFDPAKTQDGRKGIGMYTIKERVELLGGILRVRSSAEKGTSISIEVPIE
jgi:signal transduction histidine kinase